MILFLKFILVIVVSFVLVSPADAYSGLELLDAARNCRLPNRWIEGACRDLSSISENADIGNKNVVTVPENCAAGQQWISGECRDVWISDHHRNVITVPPNCPSGQEWINGQCRDVWLSKQRILASSILRKLNSGNLGMLLASDLEDDLAKNPKNIVDIPNQCPAGFRPDANGVCREIW